MPDTGDCGKHGGKSRLALLALVLVPTRRRPRRLAPGTDNRVLGDMPRPPAVRETITTDTSAGYARIMVTFAAPTPVTASIADGVLTVKLGAAHRHRPERTGRRRLQTLCGVRAARSRRPDLSISRWRSRWRCTLRPRAGAPRSIWCPMRFAGVPPDLPPPPPRRSAPPSTWPGCRSFACASANIANFTRLVFDWPRPVAYTVYPGKGRVTVRFETLARPDFSMLHARSPAWVKNAGWRIEDKSTGHRIRNRCRFQLHDMPRRQQGDDRRAGPAHRCRGLCRAAARALPDNAAAPAVRECRDDATAARRPRDARCKRPPPEQRRQPPTSASRRAGRGHTFKATVRS